MRAVQLTAYGNPVEGLKYVDIPAPDAPGRTSPDRRRVLSNRPERSFARKGIYALGLRCNRHRQ